MLFQHIKPVVAEHMGMNINDAHREPTDPQTTSNFRFYSLGRPIKEHGRVGHPQMILENLDPIDCSDLQGEPIFAAHVHC